MFLLDTATCIIDVNNAIREITLTLTSTSPLSLADRYELASNLPWPVESALYSYMSNLGDVIIIWRAYVFWREPNERWVILIPLACLLGSIISSALISFCVAKLISDPQLGDFVNPPFCKNVQLSSYVTALIRTAVATLMICYKTWQYRRRVSTYLHSTTRKTRAEKVMTILVESGVLYFIFFLSAVIDDSGNIGQLENSTPLFQWSTTIWTYMTSHILGIYPVVIVLLVTSQKSYIESATNTSGNTASTGRVTYTTSSAQGWAALGSRSKFTTSRSTARSHVVDIGVHELREVHPSDSVDYTGTIEAEEKSQDSKLTPVP